MLKLLFEFGGNCSQLIEFRKWEELGEVLAVEIPCRINHSGTTVWIYYGQVWAIISLEIKAMTIEQGDTLNISVSTAYVRALLGRARQKIEAAAGRNGPDRVPAGR